MPAFAHGALLELGLSAVVGALSFAGLSFFLHGIAPGKRMGSLPPILLVSGKLTAIEIYALFSIAQSAVVTQHSAPTNLVGHDQARAPNRFRISEWRDDSSFGENWAFIGKFLDYPRASMCYGERAGLCVNLLDHLGCYGVATNYAGTISK